MVENQRRAFLEIEDSIGGYRWEERLTPTGTNIALAISQTHNIQELVARVIAARGVNIEDAARFLDPTIRDLMPAPASFTDMQAAVERISHAIIGSQRIAIFGDYDVDGAASSALVSRFLSHYGIPHEIYIPDRIFEGYGPNPGAINELAGRGAKLVITVDCGSSSFEAFEKAKKLGIDIVTLDHHQMDLQLPVCHALVNPNRQDDMSGQGHLCAAGVVFITLVGIVKHFRETEVHLLPPNLLNWLDLVALATVCDVVPLQGVNRAFVVKGIQVMRGRKNPGLAALSDVARLDTPPTPYHLGFLLGPRINAGGRIGDAALGAHLLSSNDNCKAQEIAEKLEILNRERQEIEARMLEEAISEAEAEIGDDGYGPPILVTESESWHPGIVGLLASRIRERYKRPTFVIAFDRSGRGSGSGRSISGIDIGAAVRSAVKNGTLEKGGGHSMAAGFTVKREKLAEMRSFFEEYMKPAENLRIKSEKLLIDGAMTARGATINLIESLERAGPYGSTNPAPVFVFPNHRIEYISQAGEFHLRLTLSSSDGAKLAAIAFRVIDTPLGNALLASRGKILHTAGVLDINTWRGQRKAQLRVIDAATPCKTW